MIEHKKRGNTISAIVWTADDIRQLLKEYGIIPSDNNIDCIIEGFNSRLYEENCILYGWELLNKVVISNSHLLQQDKGYE